MRKKVDARIRTLVENGVKLGQRSMFVIVGDKGRDQVGNREVGRGMSGLSSAAPLSQCPCRWSGCLVAVCFQQSGLHKECQTQRPALCAECADRKAASR